MVIMAAPVKDIRFKKAVADVTAGAGSSAEEGSAGLPGVAGRHSAFAESGRSVS
ncbi:MAG: hypothetical protein JXJ19_07030 [Elusimicrobia bacterium]|nr:hypothetical protein [Elusimicrobiota bacterium]